MLPYSKKFERHKYRKQKRRKKPYRPQDKWKLFKQSNRCHYCDLELDYYEATIDHVIPLSRGGSDLIENKVIACGVCNQEKGNLLVSEWKRQRGY